MEEFKPNLTIDDHIELLPQEELDSLFLELAKTVDSNLLANIVDDNLTVTMAKDYLNYELSDDEFFEYASSIVNLAPTPTSVKQLAIDNPTQATEVLNELLYWRKQGRI
jgi:hypothetical protein